MWKLKTYHESFIDFVDDKGKVYNQGLVEPDTTLAVGTKEEVEALAEIYAFHGVKVYWELA